MHSTQTLVQPARGWRDRPPEDAHGAGRLVLDRYRLLERLGSGGFGVVWRAHDQLLDRQVALKRIPLAPGGDHERASREALASARLGHPAIVALYEACAVEDAFYLISELVVGDTLAHLASSLSDARVLEIGVALSEALAHAHARGVIHRDVKPQNVLVPHPSDDGTLPAGAVAKLTDFGGARLAGDDALTRTGDVLGTLAYMAPEQSDGGEVGEAADLYSLALVLYEALCGFNPVKGPTTAATARRIGCPIEPLERTRGELPRALTRALDRALAPELADRGTLAELNAALLDALQAIGPASATQPSTLAGTQPPAPSEERPPALFRARRLIPQRDRTQSAAGWSGEVAELELGTAAPAHDRPPAHDPAGEIALRRGPGAHTLHREPGAPAVQPQAHGLALGQATDSPALAEQVAAPALEQKEGRTGRDLVIPRRGWIVLTGVTAVWQISAGRPGAALLAVMVLAPLVALAGDRRSPGGSVWLLSAALAPALGLARLAGVFPAIAGQAARWRTRAMLGALGYWWLTLAEPLLGRRLWLGPPAGTPARSAWEGSLHGGAAVAGDLLSLGALLGAALWAAGAVCLPWIVQGRRAALDVVAVTIWSALISGFAPLLDGGLSSGAAHASPSGAVIGAVCGGLFVVAARAIRGPV